MELQHFRRLNADEDDDGLHRVFPTNSSSNSISLKREPLDSTQLQPEEEAEYDERKEDAHMNIRRSSFVDSHYTDRDGNIVVATNIHKTYLLGIEGVPALRGVSLSIKRGEFITILGASGGGKTSLLNVLGTIDKPTKGELHICGHRQLT